MKDSICLIWFTGLISQYDVSKYDIENLVINNNLLNKVMTNYEADKYMAFIMVRNYSEKQQYENLLKKTGLDKRIIPYWLDMNIPLYDNLKNQITELSYYYNLKYYIDCGRNRLCSLLSIVEPTKLIHISQLLD